MSFAAPIFLWLLLAIPVVVALHFVRTRRKRVAVSALFLWTQARELAQRRRRFDRSWLLALQIAAVTAAALALARPELRFAAAPDRVLVVDASASMAAATPEGGTRLDAAVERARDQLGGGGRVALIRAGLDATVTHPLDTDRAGLRDALAALAAGDRDSDLPRALALARSVAPGGEIHLFGDRAPDVADAPGVRFHPAGPPPAEGVAASAPPNVGIASFDLGLQQAFVAIASSLSRPTEVDLVLEIDGRRVASSTLLLPVGRSATATFPVAEEGIYTARIVPPADDALALDDVAYAGRGTLRVALASGSVPLERALAAVPGTAVRFASLQAPADVHVLLDDRALEPEELPPGRYLAFAERSSETRTLRVRDFDQSDPLLRFVDLRDVTVAVDADWRGPEDEGWSVLASGADLTPLLLRWQSAQREVIYAPFHPSQTDMVYRPAFPALIANALQIFGAREPLPLGAPLPAGATRLPAEPGGEEVAAGARALTPGIYRVAGRLRPVSLLASAETRLAPLPPATDVARGGGAQLAPETTVDPAAEPAAERTARGRDLALAFVMLGLVALVVEWLLYSGGLGLGGGRRGDGSGGGPGAWRQRVRRAFGRG